VGQKARDGAAVVSGPSREGQYAQDRLPLRLRGDGEKREKQGREKRLSGLRK